MRKIMIIMLFMMISVPLLKAQDTITEITIKRIYISKHPQDPEYPQFIIYSKKENLQLGFGGYAKLTMAFDFNGLVGSYDFITFNIPVEDQYLAAKRLYLDAHQSRIYGEVLGHVKGKLWRIYIEVDFYSEHYYPRLRHAYGQIGGFLFGQTWSTLMDLDAMPNTIDFEGPNSAVALRVPMLRYSHKSKSIFSFMAALEIPEVSMSYPYGDSVPDYQYVPDMISNFRIGEKTWHVQMGVVFRTMSYKDDYSNNNKYVYGFGGVISSSLKLSKSSRFMFQVVFGKGIAKYIQDISGVGYDASRIWDKYDRDLHAIPCWGSYFAFEQYWYPRIYSTFVYSYTHVNNNDRLGPGEPYYKAGHYFCGNLFWDIFPSFSIAIEYNWGQRINEGDNCGWANRINAMAQFNF